MKSHKLLVKNTQGHCSKYKITARLRENFLQYAPLLGMRKFAGAQQQAINGLPNTGI